VELLFTGIFREHCIFGDFLMKYVLHTGIAFSFLFSLLSGVFGCQIGESNIQRQSLSSHRTGKQSPFQHRGGSQSPFQHKSKNSSPYKHNSNDKSSIQYGKYGKNGGGNGSGSWLCSAVGYYKSCRGGMCYPKTANGMGMGPTEGIARIQAEVNCNSHMTNMVIIGNMGDGAHVTAPCVSTTCSQ